MDSEYTQQQSLGGLRRSERLSLQATMPPAEIPGYRIERLLGQGAFGQVWLGRDLNTGRQVAIKFYLHRHGVNWTLLSREVKYLVNMSTARYIVQVLGVGWDAQPPYYIMEYLERGSLEDLIRERGVLSTGEAVSLFREIAQGLNYAHSKGVLHCDLKPANVMLDHDQRPRLADFGQSRMSDDQTPSLGTLFFMAPEQADLQAAPDVAWDVYALGAIAYSMLVGSPPYRSAAVVEQLDTASSLPDRLAKYRETIRTASRPRLHYRRRGVDKALCQIIDRCLAKNPKERYGNVQQVIEAIDARHAARMRRPIYLLGIVGPILLLLLILFFSNRSIALAKIESLRRVQTRSLEANQFAALFVAGTLEGELARLYRLIESEAARPQLADQLQSASQAGRELIDEINRGDESSAIRDALRREPERIKLNGYIRQRLDLMVERGSRKRNASQGVTSTIFNSLFVVELGGTNLGISFADPELDIDQSPVARNFAYRSYFTGLSSDGDPSDPASQFEMSRRTHLSAPFQSTSTGKWKIGISTPIWPPAGKQKEAANSADRASSPTELKGESELRVERSGGDDPSGSSVPVSNVEHAGEPIGVLVLTINLGDFELLSGSSSPARKTRFAAIVDGRQGPQQGTLLQHPVLDRLSRPAGDSGELLEVPQIPQSALRQLRREGMVDYRDPAADFENGEPFEGKWIAAIQPVRSPEVSEPSKRFNEHEPSTFGDAAEDSTDVQKPETVDSAAEEPLSSGEHSGLWVLVQERGSTVAGPVTELGSRLQRETYLELGTLLSVVLILWFFVFRLRQVGKGAAEPSDWRGSEDGALQATEANRD